MRRRPPRAGVGARKSKVSPDGPQGDLHVSSRGEAINAGRAHALMRNSASN